MYDIFNVYQPPPLHGPRLECVGPERMNDHYRWMVLVQTKVRGIVLHLGEQVILTHPRAEGQTIWSMLRNFLLDCSCVSLCFSNIQSESIQSIRFYLKIFGSFGNGTCDGLNVQGTSRRPKAINNGANETSMAHVGFVLGLIGCTATCAHVGSKRDQYRSNWNRLIWPFVIKLHSYL